MTDVTIPTDTRVTINGREIDLSTATFEDLREAFGTDGAEQLPPSVPTIRVATANSSGEAAKYAGMWYHTGLGRAAVSIECVLLFRTGNRDLYGKGDERAWCRSVDGRRPLPGQRVWSVPFFTSRSGQRIDMAGKEEPEECQPAPGSEARGCVFAGHVDPVTGDWVSGECRTGERLLVMLPELNDGIAFLSLTATQAAPLKRFLRDRISNQLPLCWAKVKLTPQRVEEKGRDPYYAVRCEGEVMSHLDGYRAWQIREPYRPMWERMTNIVELEDGGHVDVSTGEVED